MCVLAPLSGYFTLKLLRMCSKVRYYGVEEINVEARISNEPGLFTVATNASV